MYALRIKEEKDTSDNFVHHCEINYDFRFLF